MRIFVVDAFADAAFTGNPAAVCLPDGELPADLMQRIAAEMNLSETAFVRANADGTWSLRWFTPTVEVDLCGHATLASAHVLLETGAVAPHAVIRFNTRSGELRVSRADDGWLALDFPARPPAPVTDAAVAAEIAAALGVPIESLHAADYHLALVDSEETLRAMAPDFKRLAATGCEVIATTQAAEGDGADFLSRFFAPACGVDEDPVTGSSFCTLMPFWADRLGRSQLRGRQISERGGEARLELRGDRVIIEGRTVTVLRGELDEAVVAVEAH